MGGGSKAPATTTTIQKTELPPWLEQITRENLAIADRLSQRPYEAYGGQTIAGFSPEQEQAFKYMQAGVGMFDPMYKRASRVTNSVAGYNPMMVNAGSIGYDSVAPTGEVGFERVNAPSFLQGDIKAYMNPYIDNVENAAVSRLQDATRQNINTIGDQARAAGAFGGSRQGIAEGVAYNEGARSAGELSANLRSQGFNQAAGLMQADNQRAMQAALANQAAGIQTGQFNVDTAMRAALANQAAGITTGQANLDAMMRAQLANQNAGLQGAQLRLGAANQLSSLAQARQASRLQDASMLENIGMQRQSLQQAYMDDAYNRWLEQRNYPIEMLNLRLGATSATPYGGTSTTQSTAPRQSGNGLLTGLGAAGTAASIWASLATIF